MSELPKATPVSLSHTVNTIMQRPRPGTTSVVLERAAGLATSSCRVRAYVDEEPVAELDDKARVELFLPFGEHILIVRALGTCAGANGQIALVVAKDEPKRLTLSVLAQPRRVNIVPIP